MPTSSAARAAALVLLLSCVTAGQAAAQYRPVPDSVAASDSTATTLEGRLLDELPADRLRDALLTLPAVTAGPDSGLSLWGSLPGGVAVYVEGVPVAPGFRGFDAGVRGMRGGALSRATNAVGTARAVGPGAAAFYGHGHAGALDLRLRRPDSASSGGLRLVSDGVLGGSRALGFNRLQASLGGAQGSVRLFGALVLEGQDAMAMGAGTEDAPYYVETGIDTIVTTAGQADTVQRYGVAERTPASYQSAVQLVARAEYSAAGGTRLALTMLGGADQGRRFDYRSLYNPDLAFGERRSHRVLALALTQPLSERVALTAGVSRQRDRHVQSPLSEPDAEPGRFGFEFGSLPFHVDADAPFLGADAAEALRRSPAAAPCFTPLPCATFDQVRDGAYGLRGFSEMGVAGTADVAREQRTVLHAALDWRRDDGHHLTIGAEQVRAEASAARLRLGSVSSDIWHAEPRITALYIADRFTRGALQVSFGARYDLFTSGGRRPYYTCTEAQDQQDTSPDGTCGGVLAVGERQPFPRLGSSPLVSDPDDIDALLVDDGRHTAFSPRFELRYASSAATTFRGRWAQLVQVPDYGVLFAGMNTDLALTTTQFTFGSDLPFERSRIAELGIAHRTGAATHFDAALFRRWTYDVAAPRLVRRYDPARGFEIDLREWTAVELPDVTGLTGRVDHAFGPTTVATVAYTYLNGEEAPWIRPHSVAATLAVLVRERDRLGRETAAGDGLFATFRYGSGTEYRECLADPSALSDELCAVGGVGAVRRLPALHSLDLRVAKRFGSSGAVALFADVRNVLDRRNVLRVFGLTGTTASPVAEDLTVQADSASLAAVAAANGVYDAASGAMDLRFGGARASGCGGFVDSDGDAATADCVYLARAEARFGNDDGIYSVAEQRAASAALYRALFGPQLLTGDPRRLRVGIEIDF